MPMAHRSLIKRLVTALVLAIAAGQASAQMLPIPAPVPTAAAVLAQQQAMIASTPAPVNADDTAKAAKARLQRVMGMH